MYTWYAGIADIHRLRTQRDLPIGAILALISVCTECIKPTRSVYFSYVASLPVDHALTLELTVIKSVSLRMHCEFQCF